MVERTLSDEIISIVNSVANNNPAPVKCKITKTYNDNFHADIETDLGIIEYVETISNNLSVGNIGILVYLNGGYDEYIVITK